MQLVQYVADHLAIPKESLDPRYWGGWHSNTNDCFICPKYIKQEDTFLHQIRDVPPAALVEHWLFTNPKHLNRIHIGSVPPATRDEKDRKNSSNKITFKSTWKREFCWLEWYFRRAETSRIVLKVNSNPRQLNATEMAKILDADATLKEHAKNDLALEIKSFEVGDANVSSVRRLLQECFKTISNLRIT